MTTREFINKAFYGQTKRRECSSVFVENGNLYSYGYHYPLLFRVNGHAIRNVSGYSPTTARHIMWSRDIDALDVHAGGQFRLSHNDNINMAELLAAQRKWVQMQHDRVTNHRARGRREDTQLFKHILDDVARAEDQLAALEAIA